MFKCRVNVISMYILLINVGLYPTAYSIVSCPSENEITPCTCSIKKNGLDIICEYLDTVHITKALNALKQKENFSIFYLKLRHNNIPKLQGFIFLGLDIHHLTIHNASLSVIENSSLSSVGKNFYVVDLVIS